MVKSKGRDTALNVMWGKFINEVKSWIFKKVIVRFFLKLFELLEKKFWWGTVVRRRIMMVWKFFPLRTINAVEQTGIFNILRMTLLVNPFLYCLIMSFVFIRFLAPYNQTMKYWLRIMMQLQPIKIKTHNMQLEKDLDLHSFLNRILRDILIPNEHCYIFIFFIRIICL